MQVNRYLSGLLIPAALFLLLFPVCALAQDFDDLDEDIGDVFLDLDGLKGKERVTAISKLCKSDDEDSAEALVSVLAAPKDEDTQDRLEAVFEALLRLKNEEISEELTNVMSSPDPVMQGYAYRIYARTFGVAAARELLPKLSTAQAQAKDNLLIALRDCPSPAVVKALRRLVQRGEGSVAVYVTLLRLGDAGFSKEILMFYGSASDQIRALREALIYPSDRRKAARDRTHLQKLIEQKADVRRELALLPRKAIPPFAEAAATIHHPDVWSLLARLLPKQINDETASLFGPLMNSPSIEVSTLIMEAIASSKDPNKSRVLSAAIGELAESPEPELRKQAVRFSDILEEEPRVALATRLLEDPDKWVRIESIEKLAEWKVLKVKDHIEGVLKSTEDPDLQWSAQYAMRKLK